MDNGYIYFSFSLYMLLMLTIGGYFYFKTKNVEDYVLGGRTLGPFPSALSSVASDMSGWLLLGLPGFAITGGMQAFWIAFGLYLGIIANWQFVAKRLRIFSEKAKNSITIPGYIENRFQDHSGILRLIIAVVILFFFLFYTASGFVAGGKLFSEVFGINYKAAVFIGMLLIVGYTLVGGYMAVCWTDVIQGLLMLLALVVVPLVALSKLGGWGAVQTSLDAQGSYLDFFKKPDGTAIGFITIISLMAWGLGYFGQPHIISRFMGISSAKEVNKAKIIASTWSFFTMIGAILIGLIGAAYFVGDNALADPERVFVTFVGILFHPLVSGILLAAIMAAIMSTADSQLLIASAAFTSDIFERWIIRNQKDNSVELLVGRLAVLVIAIVAAVIALDENSSVLSIVSYAWAGLGATCGPVILISLYWRRMNLAGAIAGVVVGAVVVIGWNKMSGGIFDVYELLPAFILASAAIFIVSLVTKEPDEDVTAIFDESIKEV